MAGWSIVGNRYPFTYSEPPEKIMLRRTDHSDSIAYVPERTCHEVIVDKHWRGCSECSYKWEFMYGIGKCERPNYCPQCGAKVVE